MSETQRPRPRLGRWTALAAAAALLAGGSTACIHVHHYGKRPKAKVQQVTVVKPAHPHASDVQLVFDPDLDVYVVVGHPGHYHYDGRFYRNQSGRWWVSTDLHDHWVVISTKNLPPGLQRKNKKGHYPASRRR